MAHTTRKYTDHELLDGIRRRDNTALATVYREYRPRVVAQVCSWGGSADDARDVFQEAIIVVFIKARLQDFQLTCALYTFLHAVSHNLWLKKVREKTRHDGVSLDVPEVLTLGVDPSDALEVAERQQFIAEKFIELGNACRDVLRLSIIEEKTPEEIVEALGLGSLSYYYKRKSICKDKLAELARRDARYGAV